MKPEHNTKYRERSPHIHAAITNPQLTFCKCLNYPTGPSSATSRPAACVRKATAEHQRKGHQEHVRAGRVTQILLGSLKPSKLQCGERENGLNIEGRGIRAESLGTRSKATFSMS